MEHPLPCGDSARSKGERVWSSGICLRPHWSGGIRRWQFESLPLWGLVSSTAENTRRRVQIMYNADLGIPWTYLDIGPWAYCVKKELRALLSLTSSSSSAVRYETEVVCIIMPAKW